MTLRRLSHLIGEHVEVSIDHKVDHVIRCGHVKLFAEPINGKVSGDHRVEQEILQVLQGLGIGENGFCFIHATIISTGFGALVGALCHLANWEAADSVCVSQLL